MRFSRLVVVWRVTEQCNLACRYCGYDRSLNRLRRTADPTQVASFGALLHEYGIAQRRDVLVSWLGGEPLLWPPLPDTSARFKREFGLGISVTTNGTMLGDPRVRAQIVRDYDEIIVSVDGIGAVHDDGRGATALFERLKANVIALHQFKRDTGAATLLAANTVLMHDNIRSFGALCQELAGWGIRQVTFNALGGRDRPEFYPAHRLRSDDVAWLRDALPRLRERMAGYGLIVKGSDAYVERLMAWTADVRSAEDDCAAGRRFLFVDERGRVAPCHVTTEEFGVPVERIRTVQDLHELPRAWAAQKRRAAPEACGDCRSTQWFGKFESSQ